MKPSAVTASTKRWCSKSTGKSARRKIVIAVCRPSSPMNGTLLEKTKQEQQQGGITPWARNGRWRGSKQQAGAPPGREVRPLEIKIGAPPIANLDCYSCV